MRKRLSLCVLLAASLGFASSALALSPFALFFESGSTRLDARAGAVLDNAARAIREGNIRGVALAGATDRRGSSAANLALGRRRAEAVRDALVARGAPIGIFTIETWGEDRPLVPTADGVSEAQNRLVYIALTAACPANDWLPEPPGGC
jgi:outer membrane protein OmpA-like peptidoglycan-associated protein